MILDKTPISYYMTTVATSVINIMIRHCCTFCGPDILGEFSTNYLLFTLYSLTSILIYSRYSRVRNNYSFTLFLSVSNNGTVSDANIASIFYFISSISVRSRSLKTSSVCAVSGYSICTRNTVRCIPTRAQG